MGCLLAAPGLAQKKRVAVLDFDYAPVHSTVYSLFGRDQDVGKGLADLLVQKLVQDGVYTIVERKALDKIVAEQNFSNSDRADATTAAKIGRILGVDAIVIGTVTQFGQDEKKKDYGGALGGLSRYGLGGIQKHEAKALVTVSGRMINTDTGEVLVAANGQGQSSRSATSVLGSGGYIGAAGTALDMTSQDFSNTIMGEAVNTAVGSLARQFESSAGRVTGHKLTVDGLVADVTGDQIVVNVGSRAGLKVGDRLEVRRKAREIRDPASGRVIRRVEDTVGSIVLTDVDEQSSVGKFSGSTAPKVGDAVKLPE